MTKPKIDYVNEYLAKAKRLMCRLLGQDYNISLAEYDDNGILRYTKDQCTRCGHIIPSVYASWFRIFYDTQERIK